MGQQVKLKKEKKKIKSLNKELIKIVLLGPGEVGKSTVFKQFQLIFGLNQNVVGESKTLKENILIYFRECIDILENKCKWNPPEDPFHKKNIDIVKNLSTLQIVVDADKFPLEEIKKTISFLYQEDLEFKRILKYNHKYSLWDSANFVLSKAEDYLDPKYVFNEKDYISAYKKTTGVSQFDFTYKDQKFTIFDTGGQRNER
jgi:GTPase SAR1 family protein